MVDLGSNQPLIQEEQTEEDVDETINIFPVDPDLVEENEAEEDLDLGEFNRMQDYENMCPDWTKLTAGDFRNRTNMDGPTFTDDMDDTVLPLDSLNAKQRFGAQIILENMREVLGNNNHQFFLEIAGSAGTGKTTMIR